MDRLAQAKKRLDKLKKKRQTGSVDFAEISTEPLNLPMETTTTSQLDITFKSPQEDLDTLILGNVTVNIKNSSRNQN